MDTNFEWSICSPYDVGRNVEPLRPSKTQGVDDDCPNLLVGIKLMGKLKCP